jgi:hypothetical protein
VEAIKEQQKQLEELNAQIENQKTHMEDQDRKIDMLVKEIETLKNNR